MAGEKPKGAMVHLGGVIFFLALTQILDDKLRSQTYDACSQEKQHSLSDEV